MRYIKRTGKIILTAVVTGLIAVCCMAAQAQVYRVGDLYTSPDGSQGIVYWLNPDGSGGWVVALNDDAAGCPWGTEGDIPGLDNQNPGNSNRQQLLNDTAGYAHTAVIRAAQGAGNTAAGAVDFDHGWYLPAPDQLIILYGQLPFIEAALVAAGGTTLTMDYYWCSAEVDAGSAWGVYGSSGYFYSAGKTGNARVRAVRSFTYAPADGVTYAWSDGSTGSSVTVLPTGTATWSVTATSGSCEASDTVTVTGCAPVVPSLFDGLVAYYPFDDDDLTDHTGNGNNGNNHGTTATTDRFCREGKARNFAGVDSPQYIDVPNSSSLQFTDAATVSLWFCMNGKRGMDGWGYPAETGNNHYLFAKLWDSNKNMRTRVSVLNNGEFILASEITQSCAEDTLHGLQLGQWMQATIVYTTTYIETYVNGQLIARTDASNSFSSTNNQPLRFGMMGGNWYPMNGKLDDIRIFNRALNAGEVEQLYLLDIVPQDSLLVYLPLNGNVTDYSGNGFQPVLHGNVTPTAGHYGDDSTAYHFPGEADSWIEIPNDDRLNLCGSFTVSAWYNREVGWQYGNLVSKGRDVTQGWKLGTGYVNVNGSPNYGYDGMDANAQVTPVDGNWYMTTGVYDSATSTLRYYLNGELQEEVTNCGTPLGTNHPVAIGRHVTSTSALSSYPSPFKGEIDDIVIYNRPLSAEEVHALYVYNPHAVGCAEEEECLEPNNITVNNITPTSVNLGWTGTGDSYIVQYRQLSYLLEEGFENGIPSSWTIIDADGDGYHWEHSSTHLGQVTGHDGSQGFATSASYISYVGALTPDNWLISPTINLTTDNTLTFYVTPQDESWPNEHWGIYISPTGSLNLQDFVLLYEETLVADGVNEWTERNLDLSDYSGQTVRIAFRHFNCSDWYFLDLDDVNIHDNIWETVSTNEPWLTLTDLLPETHYVFRIKTLCGNGVIESSWSEQGNFTTGFIDGLPCPGHETVTDHEGNVYNTVKIGNQCWTKENMRCTTSPRGHLSAGGSNNNLTTPYYYEYPSSSIPLAERGYLYNWAGTMDTTTEINGSFMGRRGICPEGWHVPSDQEFSELINYLGSVPAYQCGGSSGNVAKALASTNYWNTDSSDCTVGNDPSQNNATGFSAIPAGYFYNSQFFYEREYGSFWSSTSSNGSNAYWYSPHFDMAYIIRGSIYKEIGRSVRCLLGSIDEPSVSTAAVTDITSSTAICGGIVTSDGGSEINTRGVCWSTSPNPTLNDNYTNDGTGTGAFTSNITGLTPCTTYYVRAFARNYAGTRYGEEFSFTTEPITTTFDTVVCSSELPLTWNGYTFFGEGTHTFTLQNANGCDSTVTLHLIVGSILTFEMHDSFGDGWNGNKILVHNHDTIQEVTLEGGHDGTVSIPVHNGSLELEWVDGGWKEECSVTITGPCINYSTTSAPSGYFLNGNINCQGGTPAVPSFNYWMENTCNSVIVHFENTSTDADSASWNIAGYTSSEWNPAYEFTESGNYTVTLQAYNSSCELNWEQTQGFMVNVPAPITTTLDTAVCAPDLPLTWHGHTFSDYETYTSVLQSATGCDSTVTLTVRMPSYALSDDFNDGVIDPARWTYTGNAVLEENGQLKLQQNVTDQDVHLRSVDMQLPASGKVAMDRRFMLHRSNNYYYGHSCFYLNGGTDWNNFVGIQYDYGAYEGWYGTYLVYKLDGMANESRIWLCDATFDTWVTDHVELDFITGSLSYYMDTLVATVSIPELSNQTVNYYNVEFRPSGWWTGHQHYMDWVDIYGDLGLVSTAPVSGIGGTSATCGGTVSSDDCTAFTTRGVCWSTSHFPTLADAHTSDGTGAGTFTSALTNLTPGTTYYVRACATNNWGTVYGNEVSFTTLASDTTYTTITIGNGESSDYNLPFNNFYKNSWSQMIYPASQINETGNITSIAFYVDAVPSMNYPFSTLSIYMGISEDSVNATTNSWLPMSELSEVYSTTDFASPIDTGWQTFNLSTPFPYDGSGHLVIVTSKTMPNYTNALRYRYTTGAANCCIYRRSDSSPEIYASHPGSATGTLSDRLPNLRFTIEVSGDFCYGVTDLAVNDISKTGAAISWSPSNSANVGYIMQYKTTDQNWDDATTIIVYDTTYDLAGMLTSSTIYNIRIATNCGENNSAWKSTSFATLCDTIASLPYMEGFDTYGEGSFPLCWTKHTDYSSSSDYPYVSSSQHSGGTASLYFYKPSSNYMYAASQALNLANYSAGDLALNFNLRPDGLSNARIDVGIMSDPEDLATFTLLKSYYPSDFSANNQWHSFSIPFTQHYANPIHIAFYAPSSYSNTRMYVDEVKVDFVPVCSAPSNLTISDIAGTSAIVSWTGSQYGDGSYTVEYSDDGTVWSSLTTSETHVMLTGLTPTTTHQVRVYQNCNTNQSDTLTDSFTTHCLAGGDLQVGNGTETNQYLPSYNFYKYSLSEQLFTAEELGGANTFYSISFQCSSIVTPSREWTIYLMPTSATSLTGFVDVDSTAAKVFEGTVSIDTGWFVIPFDSAFAYDGTSNLILIVDDNTGSYVSTNKYFVHTSSSGNSYYRYNDGTNYDPMSASTYSPNTTPYRNNVIFGGLCDSVVTCFVPNAHISGYDNESIEVTWAPGYTEDAWELEYQAEGDAEWTSVANPSSPMLISNLTSGVLYDIRLRAVCSDYDFSDWVILHGRTECDYITSLPYTEDFENATGESPMVPCWTRGTNSSTQYPYTSSSQHHSGSYSLYFYGSSASYSYAATPRFDDSIPMDSLEIHFHALKTSSSNYFVEVGIMTNPDDPNTFTLIGSFCPSQANTFELGEVFTNDYSGNGHYVAFRCPQWVTNEIYLDDVVIDYTSNCAHVSNIHPISLDSTSATIGWAPGGTEVSWNVYIVEGTTLVNVDTLTPAFVSDSTFQATNLLPNTIYTAYVQANCGYSQSYPVSGTFVTSQIPAQIPYFCDFEDESEQFSFENGNAANKWYIGTAANNGGSHALYISQDYGVSNTYNNSSSQVWAYRDIYFPESDDDYLLSFDWRCTGESHYDYMMVYLGAPAHIEPNSSAQPDGSMVLTNANNSYPQEFNLKDSYQHFSTVLSGQGTETVRRLYFYWHNDGYGCYNPAASVDNILITPICTHSTEVVTACESYLWEDGNTYTVSGTYVHATIDTDGCANVDTLFLTINHAVTSTSSVTVCGDELPYAWNGITITEAGAYTTTLQAANGCDSTVTLTLNVVNGPSLTHTPDTLARADIPITLWANGANSIVWTDANGDTLGIGGTLTVTPTETTTYFVTGSSPNLVFNGDFEQGDTGFTTSYNFYNYGNCGNYYIGHENHEMWSWDTGDTMFDHTTGNGMWMMVDAVSNYNIWTQTVNVTPNTDYVFSAWFLTDNIAEVKFEINDVSGSVFTTPQQRGVWERQQFLWNSGTDTTAVLKITSGYASCGGNDFGIDDIVFAEHLCEATESITVSVSDIPAGDALPCPGHETVTDHEGNVYATVQIGNQCWMRDNLRTTTSPSTGTYLIPAAGTGYTYTGKQARWYNNDSATYAPMNYGLLYNWNAAVDTFNTAYGETSVDTSESNAVSVTFSGHRRGICPAGWHLPSDAEWTAMTDYVSSQSEYQCGGSGANIAKALASTEGWDTYGGGCTVGNDLTANNATGFSAVPAGYCNGSSFLFAGLNANFWSSTQSDSNDARNRLLTYGNAGVYGLNYGKGNGSSVRCLRDDVSGGGGSGSSAVIDEKSCPGAPTVTDHEGNEYATVQIGDQCWMRDNLRTATSPSTGTYLIPAAGTGYTYTGKQAFWYNNDSATYAPMNYGLLYNWNAAVDTFNTAYGETSVDGSESNAVSVTFSGHRRGICPAGWHLPSDAEWTAMTNYVGGQNEYQCGGSGANIAKALASTEGWSTDPGSCTVGNDLTANNATGFSAVPAGDCHGSSFYYAGDGAVFWSSPQYDSLYAWSRALGCNYARVLRGCTYKYVGYSVRCLRDDGCLSSMTEFSASACDSYTWNGQTYTESGDYTQTFTTTNGCDSVVTLHLTVTSCIPPGDAQPCPGHETVTDYDGNVYNTVKIGEQCWMRENLRVTHYADGTSIPAGGSDTSSTNPYYYNHNSSNIPLATRGFLYNWPAAMHGANSSDTSISNVQGVCPNGWHLPSDDEWTQLTNYVRSQSEYQCGGSSNNIAKALASTEYWISYGGECIPGDQNQHANNSTGFSAVPAGHYGVSSFQGVGEHAYFWSSLETSSDRAWDRCLYYYFTYVSRAKGSKYGGFSVRCLRGAGLSVPAVSTDTTSGIGATTATCGGEVTADGGATVTARGVCWSTSQSPTTADAHTNDGTGTGAFTSTLTGLTPGTTYYVRAYATNSVGTAYGSEVSFSTLSIPAGDALPCPGHETVTDYDGNTYNTVKIGEQCWMKENLRTTHYADGVEIPVGSGASLTVAYRYAPNNNYNNVPSYGYLYNWTAVMHGVQSSDSNPSDVQGICPTGWHVPSDAEWTQLTDYVSSVPAYVCGNNTSSIAKALSATTGWGTSSSECTPGYNQSQNNAAGLSTLPTGYYSDDYYYFSGYACYWSATEESTPYSWKRDFHFDHVEVSRNHGDKANGFAVRCVLSDNCLSNVTEFSDTMCQGSYYFWNGQTYTESGNYTQTFTNAAGCDSIVTLHLTIDSAPTVTSVTASATAVCSGSQVTFTATGDANTAYHLWYSNGVEVPGENGATLTVLLDEVNNYLYAAKAVSNAGCVSEEATTAPEVTVTPGYTVEVSGNGNICEGGSTTLTATVNNVLAGDALNYQWYKVTDGVPSAIYGENASSCTISDLSAGSYYYYVVVSGASGCSAISAYMPVNVTSPSAADLYDTAFNAYEWNGVTYTESGSYTQTFTNAAGCDSTVTLHLTINPAPLVTLSTTYSTICEGGITTIYANVTQGGTDILYTWFRNDVPLYSWNSSSISVDEAGVYKVMVTFNNSSTMSDPLVITVNPVPQLELTATETTICVSGTTVLSAAISNNDAVNYYWTNNYYQGSTYTLTPSSAGTYFINVTADQTTPGCVAIDSIAITVNEIPSTPIISIGSSSSVICDGGQISLTITNPLSGANYIWHKNGSVISNATQSTLTEQLFTEGGSVVQYAYTAIIELPYSGCSSLESSVALATVLPDPVASISVAGNTEICEGGTTTLVVNVNPPESNYTYRWYKDDVLIPGTIYSEYVVSEAARSTAYNFRVEVSSNPGCDVSATAPPITVMADPVVTATTSDAFSCVGGTATMSATIAGGVPAANSLNNYTYTWYLDGQPVGNGSTYTTSGNESPNNYNYHVDVLASDYGCNASSNSVSIAVVYDPTVSIVVASGYPQTVCDGGATAIKAISTGGYGDATYQWYKNGNILTGETNQILNIPALTYGTNDIYMVEVTQSGAGCANIASVNISTLVTVAPAYTATISGNGNVCEGGTVTLNATVNNVLYNDANYQWYKVTSGYPSIIDGATSSTYETSNLLLAGSYDYYVVVTSSIPGCGVTSPSVPANVVPDPTVTLQGDNSVCVGNSLSFNAFISGGVPGSEYTYSWGFAGDCSGSYETSTPYFTYDANCYDGSLSSHHYYFAVTISRNDNSGCNATSTFHTVDLYNNSTTSISESACGSYTWNGQTYTQSGDYTQTFTNAAGCDSVVTLHLTIHPIPSVSISGSSSIDYGQSATLTAYGANSYSWSTGDNTPIITASPTSTTTYSVTGTNQYGCTAMASITVTVNLVAPTVITNNVYNISANSAIGSGNVTATGGATVTARGVCWSTSHNPTLDDAHSNNSGGTGTFNSSISGLQPNTTYYVRAYATNSAGTAYGNEVSFTTTCNTVSVTISGPSSIDYGQSATLTANGASSYQWSTGETSGSITISPTANTTYTVTGTDQYGCTATASKAVTVNPVLPTVITDNVSNVSTNSATCGGNVTSSGGAYVSARGVCWSTSPNPTLNNTYTGNGGGTGAFTSYINGLSPNTTYYVRAYATNNVGTAYGQEFSFTTGCITSSNQFSMVVCDSYVWNGHTYTQSGDYTQILTNAIGCDSTVTLHLTILHSVTTTYSATECGSYNWNGQTYTESGTYTQTLAAANGCDSTVTLHLTILPSDTVSVEVTECSRYVWNGVFYTESGDYTQTFTNADGCDSVVTLHLTIERCTDEILVYPNPTSDHLHILFPDAALFEDEQYVYLFLYDPAGHLVFKQRIDSQESDLPLPILNNGLYLLEINVNGNTMQTFKQVIIR